MNDIQDRLHFFFVFTHFTTDGFIYALSFLVLVLNPPEVGSAILLPLRFISVLASDIPLNSKEAGLFGAFLVEDSHFFLSA